MIPFLTECILQDGVFWIHKFPRNSAVQLLLGRLQGKWPDEDYSTWARKKREEIAIVANKNDNKAKAQQPHASTQFNGAQCDETTLGGLRDVNSNNKDLIQLQREQIAILKQQLLQARQVQNNIPVVASPPGPVDQNDHSVQNENRSYTYLPEYDNRRKPVVQTLGTYCTIKRLVEAWNVHNHDLVDNAKQPDVEGCECKNAKMMFSKIKRSIEESMIECSKLRRRQWKKQMQIASPRSIGTE